MFVQKKAMENQLLAISKKQQTAKPILLKAISRSQSLTGNAD